MPISAIPPASLVISRFAFGCAIKKRGPLSELASRPLSTANPPKCLSSPDRLSPSSAREVVPSSTARTSHLMQQYFNEFAMPGGQVNRHHHRQSSRSPFPSPSSHSLHDSRPSHHAHSTVPPYSASADPASRSLNRASTRTVDAGQFAMAAAPAGEQPFSQAPYQAQHSYYTPNARLSSYAQVMPEMVGNAGQRENLRRDSSMADFMQNLYVDTSFPTMSDGTVSSTSPYLHGYEDPRHNYDSFQGTHNYGYTQANSDFGFPTVPGMGNNLPSYSQPSGHAPRHGSFQPQQNAANYTQADTGLYIEPEWHMLSFVDPHIQQRSTHNSILPADPRSRVEPDPPAPRAPPTVWPQPRMQQRRSTTNDPFPAPPRSRTEPGISMPHSPSASELHRHSSHRDRIDRHPTIQSSLQRQISHSFSRETCRWVCEDNRLCRFTGSLDDIKAHIRSTHLSGSQGARLECRWEGCLHHRRGRSADHTMRRDSVWRHVLEIHFGVKYRKKQPS